jgi:hypothetical protein
MFLLWAFAAMAQPNGPAILVVERANGTDYVPFSTFARCEAARKLFEQEQREAERRADSRGMPIIPGTGPVFRCIPG